MNKTLKKTLSIILTILMIVTMVPFAFAAEECTEHEYTWIENSYTDGTVGTCSNCSEKVVVINLSDWQKVYIRSDGYSLDNNSTVPFEGKYILSGETRGTVEFGSGTFDVIFHDVIVENSSWNKGLALNSTTLNAVAYGINEFVGYNHAGLSGGNSTLNLTVADNSSVYFSASDEDSLYISVNPETTLNILSGTPSADMSEEDWYYNSLTVSNGIPVSHTYTVEADTESDTCKRSCCGYYFNLAHWGKANCSTAGTCANCEESFYKENLHESWSQGVCVCGKVCEHDDSEADGFCNICEHFIGKEIKLDEPLEITVPNSGAYVYVKFIAEQSTKYVLKTVGASEAYLSVLNEDRSSGIFYETETDFLFSEDYEAGNTYYLRFSDPDGPSAFTVLIYQYCTEHTGGIQTCMGYKCENCGTFYGESGSCASGTQTCMGYKCEGCEEWYGEKGEHTPTGEQTCLGYWCNTCYEWYGEKGEHTPTGEQACGLNFCYTCGKWYGEATEEHIDEDSDDLCDACNTFIGKEEIKVGDTYVVDKAVFVKFVPTVSGTYILSSSADSDPYVDLYDSDFEYITYADDYDGLNFSLVYEYTAGETYYFYFGDYNGAYNYSVIFECKEHQGGTATCIAKAVCEACGEEYGEADPDAHIWKFGECTECGYDCEHSFTKYTETKAPTCTEAGREDSPCDYCDAMNYNTIPELNHKDTLVQVEAQAKTCTEIGWDAYEYCTACDYSTYVEIPAGHTPLEAVKENEAAPKCGVAGSYDLVVYCDVCGEELDRDTTTVDALTHEDADDDYLCDNGCGHEFEKPAVPDTPDEPTDDTCDHMCHKDGILGFFWKIICFFQKLFGIQQYCDCGQLHYDAPVLG